MPREGFRQRQDRSVRLREREELLKKAPEGAARVKVKTDMGKLVYKEFDKLADTDEVQVKKNGIPIVMKSKPGRRKVPDVGPENAQVAEIIKRKNDHLKQDPLLNMTRNDPESPDVLQEIMVGISEEVASIGFERREAERKGNDTGTLSQRRIQGLRALGDTWLKRKEQIGARGLDLDSPAFEEVFKFIAETFKDAMEASKMRPEAIETVFARFSKSVNDEWKNEARVRMKKLV